MLIRFKLSNFLSFYEEQEFSMLSSGSTKRGRKSKHSERNYENEDLSLLKFAALYGANASGKSNLANAIHITRDMIVNGFIETMRQIDRLENENGFISKKLNHKLISNSENDPSMFEYEFMLEGRYFVYGFDVNFDNQSVLGEWLVEIFPNSTEMVLFERVSRDEVFKSELAFEVDSEEEKFRIDGVITNGKENALFLTELNKRKNMSNDLVIFKKIYNWFNNDINCLFRSFPVDGSENLFMEEEFNLPELLKEMGIGITSYSKRKLSNDSIREIVPQAILAKIDEYRYKYNGEEFEFDGFMKSNNNLLKLKKTQGSLRAEEIVFHHNNNKGVGFTLGEESDGTKRLIELLSIFCNLNGPKVYIVDELDRSLHPVLVRKFVEKYFELAQDKDVITQLIVTTHETNILDLDLVRRDEIWFIEKDARHVSSLYTLDDFKVHHSKKIDRAYLIGRYGAIPEFGSLGNNGGSYNA